MESFAEGAPGVALLAAEFGLFDWHRALTPQLARLDRGEYVAELGKLLSDLPGEYADAWVKSRPNASKDAANKDGARYVFSLIASYARRRLEAACEHEVDAEAYATLIDLLRDAERQLETNVTLRHVMDNLVVQWSRLTAPVTA